MADDIRLDPIAIKGLVLQPGVAKEVLTVAKGVSRAAFAIAPKREPRHMYAASIGTRLEVRTTGPVGYVYADVDALKIEFGTNDTPRFRPLGKALETKRIT